MGIGETPTREMRESTFSHFIDLLIIDYFFSLVKRKSAIRADFLLKLAQMFLRSVRQKAKAVGRYIKILTFPHNYAINKSEVR